MRISDWSSDVCSSDLCCSTCCASWPGKRRPDGPLFQPLSRLRERPAVQAPLPPAGEGGAQRRVRARLLTGIPKTTQGNVRRKSSRLKPLPRRSVALGTRLVIPPRDYRPPHARLVISQSPPSRPPPATTRCTPPHSGQPAKAPCRE